MKKNLTLILSLIIAGTMCAPLWAQTEPTVYVCGIDGNGKAVYWKNGTVFPLTDGTTRNALAGSIFVDGNDVYVAGHEAYDQEHGWTQAKYWKNGEAIPLTYGVYDYYGNPGIYYFYNGVAPPFSVNSGATSIFVDNGNVYAVGWQYSVKRYPDSDSYYAYLSRSASIWTNGLPGTLAYSRGFDVTGYILSDSQANSIFVSNGDVYAAGIVAPSSAADANFTATYWKNGVQTNLTDGTKNAIANSIYVSGNDVYVAGYVRDSTKMNQYGLWVTYYTLKLWKNGIATDLGSGASCEATSVFVSGNDVYVAGYMSKACYWKNGQRTDVISSFYSRPSAIYVLDGDVYMAGYSLSSSIAVYWKNGQEVVLSNKTGSAAYGIFVTPGSPTGIPTVETGRALSLHAWVENGALHVSGLTAGETWSVYNVAGVRIYTNIAGANLQSVPIQSHGIYIVKQGNNAVKTIY